jgi:hypothetical protein
MRLFYLFTLAFFFCTRIQGQAGINTALKKELDSIYVLDQKYRTIMSLDMDVKGDSLAQAFGVSKEALPDHLWKLQLQVDSTNIIRVQQIIKEVGYPGKTLVGTPTNESAFYVIQHSRVIDQYLPLLKEAAEKKEISFGLYAMMLDRNLMFQGKEQLYGTQGRSIYVFDPKTGQTEMQMIIWPIKDAATVNERRKAAGFAQTVEENAKRLGIEYRVYTLEEVNRIQGK